ncbi:MAG: hypothetical protein K0U12_02735 [Gammaproteobacteria bacterium]|nr:hypothetical protein [Gammaproteobacteria bacterium]
MNKIIGHFSFCGASSQQKACFSSLIEETWIPDNINTYHDTFFYTKCNQRFVKPCDKKQPMPYKHNQSEIVATGNVYLMNCRNLCSKLQLPYILPDIELIVHAYLKWGHDCVQHLEGDFIFSIWNTKCKELFIATDHGGHRGCFYNFKNGISFSFSNSIKALSSSIKKLTVNKTMFDCFAHSTLPGNQTCFNEIMKLPAAHFMIINKDGMKIKRYWELSNCKKNLNIKTREDYYEAFKDVFIDSVKNCLELESPACAHISGGLDSSSVASVAASELIAKNKLLHGFTAIPNQLEGPSYREGWMYHEMPMVLEILNQYRNIQHYKYRSNTSSNILNKLLPLFQVVDQPLRNIMNFDWILASIEYARLKNCRTILVGTNGNGSISWGGYSIVDQLLKIEKKLIGISSYSKNKVRNQFSLINDNTKTTGKFSRAQSTFFEKMNLHQSLLHPPIKWSRQIALHSIELHYGVQLLDPTATLSVKKFCYNLPQWVFNKGRKKINRRLLVREGLAGIVPKKIRTNTQRGEQAADWFMQYNNHATQWKYQLDHLSDQSKEIIWQTYNKKNVMNLLSHYSYINKLNQKTNIQVRNQLMRCIGAALFCDAITRKSNVCVS